MGLVRIIADREVRRIVVLVGEFVRGIPRGWSDRDMRLAVGKLKDPRAWSGGILRLTRREYRALLNFNRTGESPALILVWIERFGLRWLLR